ncbi:MAG: threonine-phosphate decarboxylase CobD [Janthinobacterium lividum]
MTPCSEIVHGGSLEAAALAFPGAPQPFIDLSTGINPVPYPYAPVPPAAYARLPEPGALLALQAAAARAYGMADPAMVVAAPGTQILISLLPLLLPQDSVAVLGPTYAEHAAAWRNGGARVVEVAGAAVLEGHAAVLCNPNNPDGRRLEPAAVLALAERVRLLVVDEAFADLEDSVSVAPHVRPGMVVLRSFGKAYGLAGVRLGFALAEPALAARLRRALGPWAVSGPALSIGMQALADAGWRAQAARRLRADGARLDGLLRAAGGRIVGGTLLFRLVEHAEAAVLADRLGAHGVMVCRFAGRPPLLRLGLPAPPDWPRVSRALGGAGLVDAPGPGAHTSGDVG